MKDDKILILTSDKKQATEWAEGFKKSGYEVCCITDDGSDGVRKIEELKPDVVLLELFLKNLDGLGVMEQARAMKSKAMFVMISAVADDALWEKMMQKGATYCLLKPFSTEGAIARIDDLLQTEREKRSERREAKAELREKVKPRVVSPEEKISNIFISIGIPPHIKGYGYLREGICMAVEDPGIINNVTKVLYPKVAEKFQTSPSKVERAIRHAIEVAWNRGRTEAINSVFGARVYLGSEKPTNSEFIALVADKLILESMV